MELDGVTVGFLDGAIMIYSPATRAAFRQRLGPSWRDLADFLDIPSYESAQFLSGDEPRAIWDWLKNRDALWRLPKALQAIGRSDLASLLDSEQSADKLERPAAQDNDSPPVSQPGNTAISTSGEAGGAEPQFPTKEIGDEEPKANDHQSATDIADDDLRTLIALLKKSPRRPEGDFPPAGKEIIDLLRRSVRLIAPLYNIYPVSYGAFTARQIDNPVVLATVLDRVAPDRAASILERLPPQVATEVLVEMNYSNMVATLHHIPRFFRQAILEFLESRVGGT
ncbi:magnesium transporter MgtE N-terminal domain-containing protein [Actinomadura madurae]|uniref:magnesium transporter MgtE N-terminal domain-containing protein n=1 Tax=Actinomadura madurae TaxID=1993 RepID=UPI0015EEFFBD|nr:hypothetical protein [Actinomadura madurae]